MSRGRTFWLGVLAGAGAAAFLWLGMSPAAGALVPRSLDGVVHGVGFFGLTLAVFLIRRPGGPIWPIVAGLLALAWLIEIAQLPISGRMFAPVDALANTAGIAAALLLLWATDRLLRRLV